MTETTHPIRISVQIKPQHATYAQFRDAVRTGDSAALTQAEFESADTGEQAHHVPGCRHGTLSHEQSAQDVTRDSDAP